MAEFVVVAMKMQQQDAERKGLVAEDYAPPQTYMYMHLDVHLVAHDGPWLVLHSFRLVRSSEPQAISQVASSHQHVGAHLSHQC